ncbi:MAG: ribonuclease P protein component 1 [Candidatus Nezhaarchaeales archaeon]
MKVTPKNLVRHELIGLKVMVLESQHKGYVGISGLVIDETMNMLYVLHNGSVKALPKRVCTFIFELPDGTQVKVEGSILVGRPEDRVKRPLKRRW